MRTFVLLLLLSVPAFAEEEWKAGFGQGTNEYFVDNGPGNRFYIACGEENTSIMPTIIGESPPSGTTVSIIIDADEYDMGTDANGYIPTDCHVCGDNFDALWTALRKGHYMLVKFADGRSSKFSLKGASRAMPKEPCQTDWER